MGYANPAQVSAGIHLRQWSRAFIFAETLTSKRVVFVNLDICMGTQIIKLEVSPTISLTIDGICPNHKERVCVII